MCFSDGFAYAFAEEYPCIPYFRNGSREADTTDVAHSQEQETEMSKTIKLVAALGFVATLAACASGQSDEEFVVVEPEPISTEPAFTGKFK